MQVLEKRRQQDRDYKYMLGGQNWVQFLALLLASCVTLGKLLNLSESQFSHLKGSNDTTEGFSEHSMIKCTESRKVLTLCMERGDGLITCKYSNTYNNK